jgi:hypothetical protein
VVDPRYEDFLFTVLVAGYDPAFSPLAIPTVEIAKGKATVKAENAVSIVSVDGEYEIRREHKFAFDEKKPHVIRALTTAARSVIGIYTPGKAIRWIQ